MEDNIELKLLGITFNQIESGVYALILEDVNRTRRLAIVIGYPEAQSIECHLQKVKTPRPLTHDLLAGIISSLDARLVRVDIHRLPSGPYAGQLTLVNFLGETKVIDARSSDAIALAIRVGAPIYTSRKLLEEKGYPSRQDKKPLGQQFTGVNGAPDTEGLKALTDMQLNELIARYVSEENYEAAAEVKRELESRKKND